MRPTSLLLMFLFGLSAAADTPVARKLGTLALEPCTLAAAGSTVTVAAFCGTLPVPENRAAPAGRRIDLAVALVPSRAKQPPACISDEMLHTFAVVAPVADLPAALRERYAGLADRLSLYTPYSPGTRDAFWARLVQELRAA